MTMSHNSGSAKIYQFPARGRFAVAGQDDEPKPVAASFALPRTARVAYGSSWYHDEAILEAERTRKN
jgi:hypothetical protein